MIMSGIRDGTDTKRGLWKWFPTDQTSWGELRAQFGSAHSSMVSSKDCQDTIRIITERWNFSIEIKSWITPRPMKCYNSDLNSFFLSKNHKKNLFQVDWVSVKRDAILKRRSIYLNKLNSISFTLNNIVRIVVHDTRYDWLVHFMLSSVHRMFFFSAFAPHHIAYVYTDWFGRGRRCFFFFFFLNMFFLPFILKYSVIFYGN